MLKEKLKIRKKVKKAPAPAVAPDALYSQYGDIWRCFNPSGDLKAIKKILKRRLRNMKLPHVSDDVGNIFIGDFSISKPCIVAHMDSVHDKRSTMFHLEGQKLSSDNGIGADDKCGILAVFESLKNCDVNAVFFVDEEIGCIGATKCDKSIFDNVMYFVEVDRRGNTDVIDNLAFPCSVSEKFADAMEPLMRQHQLEFENGSYTDLSEIIPEVKKSGINLCAGYYNAHFINEYVMLDELAMSITFCISLFNSVRENFPVELDEIGYDSWKPSTPTTRSIFEIQNDVEAMYLGDEFVLELVQEAYESGLEDGEAFTS
jgi:di/tripeptidase